MLRFDDHPYRDRLERETEGRHVHVSIVSWRRRRGWEVNVHGYRDDHYVARVKGLRLDQARQLASKLARIRRRVWNTTQGQRWQRACVIYNWKKTPS